MEIFEEVQALCEEVQEIEKVSTDELGQKIKDFLKLEVDTILETKEPVNYFDALQSQVLTKLMRVCSSLKQIIRYEQDKQVSYKEHPDEIDKINDLYDGFIKSSIENFYKALED